MDLLIWGGAFLTLAGLGLLVWCILQAMRARRGGLDDAAMKARLKSLVSINLGALALSGLGLMAVIVGIALG